VRTSSTIERKPRQSRSRRLARSLSASIATGRIRVGGKGVFVLERLRPEGFQIDRAELEVVQEVIKVQAAVEAGHDGVEEDLEFHRAVAAATGNRYFLDFFNHLGAAVIPRTRINRFRTNPAGRMEYLRSVNRQHEAILEAIEAGNADAARAAIQSHLGGSRDALAATLGQEEP